MSNKQFIINKAVEILQNCYPNSLHWTSIQIDIQKIRPDITKKTIWSSVWNLHELSNIEKTGKGEFKFVVEKEQPVNNEVAESPTEIRISKLTSINLMQESLKLIDELAEVETSDGNGNNRLYKLAFVIDMDQMNNVKVDDTLIFSGESKPDKSDIDVFNEDIKKLKRTILLNHNVIDGKIIYPISTHEEFFGRKSHWFILKYVGFKNDKPAFDENALQNLMKKYPKLIYKNQTIIK